MGQRHLITQASNNYFITCVILRSVSQQSSNALVLDFTKVIVLFTIN